MKYLKNVRVAIRLPLVPCIALAALVAYALVSMTTLGAVKIGGDTDRRITTDQEILGAISPRTPSFSRPNCRRWRC